MIFPAELTPALTRKAPTTMTRVRPTFKNRFIMGLVRAMVMPAFFSRRTSSPLTWAKCSRS